MTRLALSAAAALLAGCEAITSDTALAEACGLLGATYHATLADVGDPAKVTKIERIYTATRETYCAADSPFAGTITAPAAVLTAKGRIIAVAAQ